MKNDNKNICSIKIISQPSNENPFVIIYKPKNIPSAPLTIDDNNNALSMALHFFPEIKNVVGKKQIEYGLIHRIDTSTDGLLLIATTQQSYDFFINLQKENKFIKRYHAECEYIKNYVEYKKGFPVCKNLIDFDKESLGKEKKEIIQQSAFRFFGPGRKEVRPVIINDKKSALKKVESSKTVFKIYSTKILLEKNSFNNSIIAKCEISNGFRHQVRCHLAWMNLPIKGDLIYNINSTEKELKFTAYELEFIHPITKKNIKFSI